MFALAACGGDEEADAGAPSAGDCALRQTLLTSDFVPPGFCPGAPGLPARCDGIEDGTWSCTGEAVVEAGRACVLFASSFCTVCAPSTCTVDPAGLRTCEAGCDPAGRTCFVPAAGACEE